MNNKRILELIAGLIILVFIGVVLWQTLGRETVELTSPAPPEQPVANLVGEFQSGLEAAVRTEIGQPIEGYEPSMLLQVFPGLEPQDFGGVEAQIGFYLYSQGELTHDYEDGEPIHSAAPAITEAGYKTLLQNVMARTGVSIDERGIELIINSLKEGDKLDQGEGPGPGPEPVACTMDAKQCPDGSFVGRVGPDCEFAACPESDPSPQEPVACTMDAKQCPDGSFVGRVGPDCEFAPCPVVEAGVTYCDPDDRPEACYDLYAPVCGQVQVQCFTTPCDPVPETYSNDCNACAQQNVISYTEGACEEQETVTYCDPNNRPEVCADIYAPVCGFVAPNDPLADGYYKTFASECEACRSNEVRDYTEGTCE